MNLFRQRASSTSNSSSAKVPEDAIGWCQEASTFEELGDWTRAVVCYRRALQLAPFSGEIRGRFEEAIEQQINALEVSQATVRRIANPNSNERRSDNIFRVDTEELEGTNDRPVSRIAGPKRSKTRSANLVFGSRKGAWLGGVVLALVLTSAGLLAAVSSTGLIRDFLSPSVTVPPPGLPPQLELKLTEVNGALLGGNTESAIKVLLEARKDFPQQEAELNRLLSQAYRTLGAEKARARNYPAAADAFGKAAAANQADALNWSDLGRSLREHARSSAVASNRQKRAQVLKDAEQAYLRARMISPRDMGAALGLAQVYDASNNRAKAIEVYKHIAEAAPGSAEAEQARTALKQLVKK